MAILMLLHNVQLKLYYSHLDKFADKLIKQIIMVD